MRMRRIALMALALMLAGPTLAKSKDKALPPYILQAHTVAVMIDPSAEVDVKDPRANQVAQKDVETALANWGRFQPVIGATGADLIIVIRKGHRRLVDATIPNPQQNNQAGVINPTDNGVMLGGQRPGGGPSGPRTQYPQSQTPQPQTEIGGTNDSFAVFDGKVDKPLNGAPGWRYESPDGLEAHNVPAVDQFKKAVAAGDRAAAAAAAKKP